MFAINANLILSRFNGFVPKFLVMEAKMTYLAPYGVKPEMVRSIPLSAAALSRMPKNSAFRELLASPTKACFHHTNKGDAQNVACSDQKSPVPANVIKIGSRPRKRLACNM